MYEHAHKSLQKQKKQKTDQNTITIKLYPEVVRQISAKTAAPRHGHKTTTHRTGLHELSFQNDASHQRHRKFSAAGLQFVLHCGVVLKRFREFGRPFQRRGKLRLGIAVKIAIFQIASFGDGQMPLPLCEATNGLQRYFKKLWDFSAA